MQRRKCKQGCGIGEGAHGVGNGDKAKSCQPELYLMKFHVTSFLFFYKWVLVGSTTTAFFS